MPGIKNSIVLIDFDLTRGITLRRLFDVIAQRDYLPAPSMFFEFAVDNGPIFQSHTGLTAVLVSEAPDGSSLSISARSIDGKIAFNLTATLPPDLPVVLFELEAINLTPDPIFLRVVMPKIFGVRTPGHPAHMMGAIPQEGGWVAPLLPNITLGRWSQPNSLGTPVRPLGMNFLIDVGLPNARNHMEVASIFDRSTGGGIFFCDMDGDLDNGVAPLQFNLSAEAVVGFWTGNIQGRAKLPRLAIGVHPEGDWRRAVHFYTSVHRAHWTFPSTPAWFREAAAIYTPAGGGAGGIYLSLMPPTPLADRISSFRNLTDLLSEANALGTNVLYLIDYWEGASQGNDPPYWNKGDYVPRSDLGGEQALQEGIALVHQSGGRVLLYVEPFTVYQYSQIGQAKGPMWGGRRWDGKLWGLETIDTPDNDYPNYAKTYEMVAPFQEWQDYVVSIAERLVGNYGADGIMLDSYAWQMNRPMYNSEQKFPHSAQDYSRGVLRLVERVRDAIQKINADAVVIGECTAGPIARHWDGGLSADLGFGNIWIPPGIPSQQPLTGSPVPQRLVASPVRYGIPEVHMFGNGLNLGGLHQIFAAGHGLALCSNFPGGGFMYDNAAHIKTLVEIRQAFRHVLIDGDQINQPGTDNPMVVAYQYQGGTDRIVTIVNLDDSDAMANISLDTLDPGGRWINLLSGPIDPVTYRTNSSGVFESVALTTGPGSLLVLLNIHRSLSVLARSFVK
jgi:hypothetical protein